MNKVAFLLAFIALASSQSYDVFRQIDESEFGRTLIDTLQMEMSTGEPIQRFGEIMRKLETSIEEEQTSEDNKNREYQSKCVSDLKEIEQDRAVLERKITEIQEVIDRLNDQRSKKVQTQNAKNMWKEELEGKIAELVAAREEEAAQYEEKMKQVEYAQYVFETLKRIFQGENAGFLQLNSGDASKDTLKKAYEHLQQASSQTTSFIQKKSYTSIFKVLSQITANMDQIKNSPLVNKVIALCDQALKVLEETRTLESRAETKRINAFNQEKGLLDKDLAGINTDLARLNAEILQIEDQLESYTLNMNDTKKRHEIKSEQYDDRDKDCREAAFEYEADRKARDEKRQLVSQIIGIFSANQRDFQAYIKQRAAAGDYGDYDFELLGTPDNE